MRTLTSPVRESRVPRKRIAVNTNQYSGQIAARIRELREAKGLTVEDVAGALKIDLGTLYTYENHTRNVPPDLYPQLARVLGCKSVAEFFPAFGKKSSK